MGLYWLSFYRVRGMRLLLFLVREYATSVWNPELNISIYWIQHTFRTLSRPTLRTNSTISQHTIMQPKKKLQKIPYSMEIVGRYTVMGTSIFYVLCRHFPPIHGYAMHHHVSSMRGVLQRYRMKKLCRYPCLLMRLLSSSECISENGICIHMEWA